MKVKRDFMWAVLVHLGTNLWYEEGNFRGDGKKIWQQPASPKMRFDRATWDKTVERFKESGVNTIILDIAEGMVYDSHPELATEGAWTREEMKAELERLDAMGFEVIPKLNFSVTHDYWLGEYSRMVSTSIYYKVCKDIIDEVCDLFKPRFLHLGMDEECYANQSKYDYVVIRQNDLWWHDLRYLVDCVEANGVRAMMWSDYARHRPTEFVEKCPKSVVQCVWYYFSKFTDEEMDEMCFVRVRPLTVLDRHGYDLLPCASVEYERENLEKLAEYCVANISPEHLLGLGTTTWIATTPEWEGMLNEAADTVKESRAATGK